MNSGNMQDLYNFTIGPLTIYDIVWYFMLYSFLGWVLEVIYCTVTSGEIKNRGFLNGPMCPIYGFGMVGVLMLFGAISPGGDPGQLYGPAAFALGVLVATTIELFGGWALDMLFHARWWDYSDRPFNLNGYICLQFSIYWGFIIIFAVREVHPFLTEHTVNAWPKEFGWTAVMMFAAIYIADVIVTVLTIIGLNKKLKQLDKIQSSIHGLSENLSESIGEGSLKTAALVEEGRLSATLAKGAAKDQLQEKHKELQDQKAEVKAGVDAGRAARREVIDDGKNAIREAADAKKEEFDAKLEALRSKRRALLDSIKEHKLFGPRRLLEAFPDMKTRDHEEAFEEIKKELNI